MLVEIISVILLGAALFCCTIGTFAYWKKTKRIGGILVENFSEVPEVKIQKLEQNLKDILPRDIAVTIEVYNHPREVHSPWQLWFLEKFGHYNPDKSDGEAGLTKIVLYKVAFERDEKILMHIALHEIGHYLDRNPFTYFSQRWREKRADRFAERFGFEH